MAKWFGQHSRHGPRRVICADTFGRCITSPLFTNHDSYTIISPRVLSDQPTQFLSGDLIPIVEIFINNSIDRIHQLKARVPVDCLLPKMTAFLDGDL